MMLQLNPYIPVETPKGPGYAFIVTDYSQEHSKLWTVMLENGQIWEYPNEHIRVQKNISMGRPNPEKPKVERPKS